MSTKLTSDWRLHARIFWEEVAELNCFLSNVTELKHVTPLTKNLVGFERERERERETRLFRLNKRC